MTATETEGSGFVGVFPNGTACRPLSPTSTSPSGQNIANLVVTPIGSQGKVSFYVQQATHLVADVMGYWVPAASSSDGRYQPLQPARILDTRSGAKPGSLQTIPFAVNGQGGVPASGVSAVVLNLTLTESTAAGWAAAFPGGTAWTGTSNLNVQRAGQTVPNLVIVPVGANGMVNLLTMAGGHLVADVAGYFTDGTAPATSSGLFVSQHPNPPRRHPARRATAVAARPRARSRPNGSIQVNATLAGIPAGAGAALLNVTNTENNSPGFVTVYPAEPRPFVSNLNMERAQPDGAQRGGGHAERRHLPGLLPPGQPRRHRHLRLLHRLTGPATPGVCSGSQHARPREGSMPGSYLVAGARTPIGKMSGALAGFTAAELGGIAIKAALERAGVAPEQVDYVFMGQVLLANQGQIPARQAAVKGGIPLNIPATTVNKVCLSGLNAIYLADLLIQAGEADIVIAGGMESMTNAPYLLPGARGGFRYGNTELLDAIVRDGLWCAFDACLMGAGTERYTAGSISREAQDAVAVTSHERAANAIKDGRFSDEIVPVPVPQRKGDPILVETDEGVRPGTSPESLGGLKPAFDKEGTITAGNASQISDGGSAIVMMSKAAAERLGVSPLGEVVGYGQVAGPDSVSLLQQPSRAIHAALERSGKSLADVDLFEINEAFAAVSVASMADLGLTDEVVNVNGGAIALGHPIGMSGNRLALTLLHELQRRGGGLGAAALCGGGGQGDALLVKTV